MADHNPGPKKILSPGMSAQLLSVDEFLADDEGFGDAIRFSSAGHENGSLALATLPHFR
jgi:hypothetical protein